MQKKSSRDIKRIQKASSWTCNYTKNHRKFPVLWCNMVQQKTSEDYPTASMEAMSARNRHCADCARCELRNMQFKLMPCEAEMAKGKTVLLILLCHVPLSVESKHSESTLATDVVNPCKSYAKHLQASCGFLKVF